MANHYLSLEVARDSDLCVCVLEKEAVPSITPRCWVRAELGEASASVTSAAMPMIINLTYRETLVCLPSRASPMNAAANGRTPRGRGGT